MDQHWRKGSEYKQLYRVWSLLDSSLKQFWLCNNNIMNRPTSGFDTEKKLKCEQQILKHISELYFLRSRL